MNQLGIECMIRSGSNSGGGGHQWNAIRLDGEWYNVDASIEVQLNGNNKRTYDYFNRTDRYLLDLGFSLVSDDLMEGFNANITCTGTKYQYSNMERSRAA